MFTVPVVCVNVCILMKCLCDIRCLQLEVTGSGTAFPPDASLAAIPGVYNMSDPEIDIDVYSQSTVTVSTSFLSPLYIPFLSGNWGDYTDPSPDVHHSRTKSLDRLGGYYLDCSLVSVFLKE